MSVALRAAVAGSLVASVLLSWALWSDAHRTPDLVPLFPFFSGACFLSSLFPLLHVAALLLLLSLVVAPRPSLLAAFLAVVTAIVMEDQNRLLPWLLQDVLFLAVLSFPASSPVFKRRALSVLMSGVYFWSGVHKLNSFFAHTIFPGLLVPIFGEGPWTDSVIVVAGGHLAGAGEMFLGISLLFSLRISFFAGVAMHSFILLSVICARQYFAIWPWNICCILVLLSIRALPSSRPKPNLPVMMTRGSRASNNCSASAAIALLSVICWLLPLLFFSSFVSYPANMSWAMFAGDVKSGVVLAQELSDISSLRNVETFESGDSFSSLVPIVDSVNWDWKAHVYLFPLDVLGVPFVPERSVIVSFFALLCKDAGIGNRLALEIQQPSHWVFGSWPPERLTCADVVDASCQ